MSSRWIRLWFSVHARKKNAGGLFSALGISAREPVGLVCYSLIFLMESYHW